MFCLNLIGKILLLPVWLVLVVVVIPVKLIVNMVAIAKSSVVLLLVSLAIGTIVCYKDWVQVLFLLCMIISAFLVLYGSVFVEVVIDLVREKIEKIILA